MIKKIDTLILGGGLTGIASAYHISRALPDEEILIVEKSQFFGGFCRSVVKDGFTYDYSGHLLHLRRDETRRWVFDLMKNNLREVERDSRIFSEGRLVRYPYQMNLYGLNTETIKECIRGVVEAHLKGNTPDASGSFLKWSNDVFGSGITRHFMKPYNEKLFRCSARKFNAEWCGGFVPRPSVEETIIGALSDNAPRGVGYNATFFYPKNGGIQSLVSAIMEKLTSNNNNNVSMRTALQAESMDLDARNITFSDGSIIKFRRLVSTIPLPDFAIICGMKKISERLRATSVVCFNIGVRGDADHNIHWIYFPEGKYNFYRVGFYSNINPASAPEGFYSMYVEVSLPHGQKKNIARVLKDSVSGLLSLGLIPSFNSIVSLDIRYMPAAYVLYDFNRSAALGAIAREIKKFPSGKDVYLLGRYGAWKYSYMEESLYEAMNLAGKLRCEK